MRSEGRLTQIGIEELRAGLGWQPSSGVACQTGETHPGSTFTRRTAASPLGAQPVNSYFVLRALAAREMPHEREVQCRRAAGEPAIHADRSKHQRSNSQTAGRTRRSDNGTKCLILVFLQAPALTLA
jgi:hypothetical protein